MNTYYVAGIPYSDELWHHGIKGQKWGVRRYQNEDGSLTEAGKKQYKKLQNKIVSNEKRQTKLLNQKNRAERKLYKAKYGIFNRFHNSSNILKLDRKFHSKAMKYDKSVIKGKQLAQIVERKFGNVAIKDISK